jgi:hypothetical protein
MKELTFDEQPPETDTHTLTEAWRTLWNNPRLFIRYWNYKGAVLSGFLRAPIFLITYLVGKEALTLAIAAALVQFVFRFFFAGVGGALIQAFRKVEPAWKALLAILLLIPAISHFFEFILQAAFAQITNTQNLTHHAILRSVTVSIISALFTLFAMRRGIMIVGESESKSLISDISRLPVVIFHFIAFIPNEIYFMLRRGAYLAALISIIAFGIFAQMMVWAITNKASWTYNNGQEIALLKYWGIDGLVLLFLTMIISAIVFTRRARRIA